MTTTTPTTDLDARFSTPEATATAWPAGRKQLEQAGIYWITTVRPDGRPHVTPLIAVWLENALYFCTGPGERKAKNLAHNAHVILTTGSNAYDSGLDVVVEGDAKQVRDDARLQRVADAFVAKYGDEWRFTVRDGAFHHQGGEALVFEVAPVTAFGFHRGESFSQTRWRF